MGEKISLQGQHDQIDEQQYQLYHYAEQTFDNPDVKERYDKFHWYYVGSQDPERRNNGENPFIERQTPQGDHVYTIPVFNGFDVESGRLLHISHDHWVDDKDASSWFVAEGSLNDDKIEEYHITDVRVDQIGQLAISLVENKNYHNWPTGYHPQENAPMRERNRVTARLDQNYHATSAEFVGGTYGRRTSFENIDVLNSMRRVIIEKKFAEITAEHERDEAEILVPAQL